VLSSGILTKITLDPRLDDSTLLLIWTDDQNRVVARDRSDDLRPVFVVNTCSNRLCASRGGYKHQEVQRLSDLKAEALQDLPNTWTFVFLRIARPRQKIT